MRSTAVPRRTHDLANRTAPSALSIGGASHPSLVPLTPMRYSELAARAVARRARPLGGLGSAVRIASKAWWGMATNGASGWREPHALVAIAQPHNEWH